MASDDRQHNERKWFAYPADEANSTPLKAKRKSPRRWTWQYANEPPTRDRRGRLSKRCLVGVRTLAEACLDSVQVLAQARLAKPLSSLRGQACP
jgi:hypothetical protein